MLGADTIAGFCRGDPAAVRAVVDAYGGMVFGVALRTLGDRGLAEEAAQQAFVQAWRAAASFEPSRELGPWLATIARRAAIDVHRREARRPHDGLDGAAPAALAVPSGAEDAHLVWAVRDAVAALPPDEREIVRLSHFEGFTHGEIAERLALPVGTVKSRSHRAHRRLAARLGFLLDDPDLEGPEVGGPEVPQRDGRAAPGNRAARGDVEHGEVER